MKRLDWLLVIVGAVIVWAVIWYAGALSDDCAASGGVLVRGVWGYECITKAAK